MFLISGSELHLPSTKRTCGSQPNCYACCFNNPNGITTFDLWNGKSKSSKTRRACRSAQKTIFRLPRYLHFRSRSPSNSLDTNPNPLSFLDNGSCSIYEHRPLACRSYFSIRNPEQCHPQSPDFFKHPHKQRTLPMNCTKNYFKKGNTHKIFWEPVYGFYESTKQNLDHKMTDLNLYLHQQ